MTIEDVIQSICNEQHDCRWMDTADFEKCLRRVAAEQRAIDIEKACEWLNKNLPITSEDDANKMKYKVILPRNLDVIVNGFRKAMEGQI